MNVNDAMNAVHDLDNKILTGTQGSLRVAWADGEAPRLAINTNFPAQAPAASPNMYGMNPGPYMFTPTSNGMHMMSPQAMMAPQQMASPQNAANKGMDMGLEEDGQVIH